MANPEFMENTESVTEIAGSSATLDMRKRFLEWLSSGNFKKFTSAVCVASLDKASAFAVEKKICSYSLWSISRQSVYKPVYQELLDAKLFRITDKATYRVFIESGKLYLKFLKDKPWKNVVVEPADDPLISRDYYAASQSEAGIGGGVAAIEAVVPNSLIETLRQKYSTGFRFESSALKLLASAAGVELDEHMQSSLKRIMFRRDDNIYFLLDAVADVAMRESIVEFADDYLQEYGCFEMAEFYKKYVDKVNPTCIRNADDFESFYEQIGKSGVRCVQAPNICNRIARYSNVSVGRTFKEVAGKIIAIINEEYRGFCNEDDLHTGFCMFSTDLLGRIIKQYAANELIRVEINDSICYQAFGTLGLPEDFSDVLAETLECLNDIGLEPTQDVLHTAISLKLGVNFKTEFYLPDWDTFRRLVTVFYKAEPRREWKSNIFWEVAN